MHEFVPVDEAEARTILDNPDEIYGLLERDWVEDLDWLICSPGHCDSTQVHTQFEIQETFRIARREYAESWGNAQVGGAGGIEGVSTRRSSSGQGT